ncbi:MAG: cupin domain-containing protein [Thermomicrobiales bacterium]
MPKREFDVDVFLTDYWQRKPFLIRNSWQSWRNPLEPAELAGLACEQEAEARLITQREGHWIVEHGPFSEDRFDAPDTCPWTLLVQAVDHLVPDVAALIEPFRFIPNWRIDDVMVSYATDGGGVGPHFDQYDVFLIQGLGHRRWRVGERCNQDTQLLPHDDLHLLANFEATDEWILGPGDILYVPPGIAHEGTAVGDDCMTYSIGFRAPSRSELIAHWCDHLLEQLQDDDRYEDWRSGSTRYDQHNPGEISANAIAGLQAMMAEKMLDRDAFARWFGQYNSVRKYPEIDWGPREPLTPEDIRAYIDGRIALLRNPASRFSFVRKDVASLTMFVDGASFDCDQRISEFAEQICGQDRVLIDPNNKHLDATLDLVTQLINQGSIAFDDES